MVLRDRPTKTFWRDDGSNLLFLLTNLTRFSRNKSIRQLIDEVVTVCPIEGNTHGATLLKAFEYYKFKISPGAKEWLETEARKNGDDWKNRWELFKEMNPWAEDFKAWRELYNHLMSGFLMSNETYSKIVEPWALKVLAEWQYCPLYDNKSKIKKINSGPIFFLTQLILCSSDWGAQKLSWGSKMISTASKAIKDWIITLQRPHRNMEIFVQLGLCQLILGEASPAVLERVISCWNSADPAKKKKGHLSKFRNYVISNWKHAHYTIHILVPSFCLLERKLRDEVLLSLLVYYYFILILFIILDG